MRSLALLAAGGFAVGCTDRLPTLSGDERFPQGLVPSTIQFFRDATQFLQQTAVYTGETGALDAPFLLVANSYQGALTSHALASFPAFPDTLFIEGIPDTEFTFAEGRVLGVVQDTLAASSPAVILSLWEVTQPWDTASVSWEYAVDTPGERILWETPGGTRGELLSSASWVRGDVMADTIIWNITADVAARLASQDIRGVMVTVADFNTRLTIGPLTVESRIRASVTDTIVARFTNSREEVFIFTPDVPRPPNVLRAGGLTSDRSYLRIAVDPDFPTCPDQPGTSCPPISATDVTLNWVYLLLEPLAVPQGFRPLGSLHLSVRRVLSPELGERAILGPIIARDSIPIARFAGAGDEPIRIDITGLIANAIATGQGEVDLMLLVEPEASGFGYAWFAPDPRLRFIYTIHRKPVLP